MKQVDNLDNKLSQDSHNVHFNEEMLNEKLNQLKEKHEDEIKNLQNEVQAHNKTN